jgi:hypothetical protein
MTFHHPSNIDARGSIFNDVHRDQINIQNYSVYITLGSTLGQALPYLRSSGVGPSLPIPGSDTLSQEIVVLPTCLSAANSTRDIAACLIVKIVQSLMASDASDQFRGLKEDLNILQQTLTLTGLAIQAYEHTPLAPSLANVVGKETERCLRVLRTLNGSIDAYQQGLNSTRLNFFWGQVWLSAHEQVELASLRRELSDCQKSLSGCLRVLDS